jgi:Fuc2NAc and GlcNAc transferase
MFSMDLFAIILLSFLASILLTTVYLFIARKKKILDIPNQRSAHKVAAPRGGGIGFVSVWFIFLVYIVWTENNQFDLLLAKALLPGILIVIVGMLDDIFSIGVSFRIVIQTLSTIVALYLLGGFQILDLGIGQLKNPILLNFLAVIYIIWMTNIFNFMDGIDGYSSTEAIIILCAFVFFAG